MLRIGIILSIILALHVSNACAAEAPWRVGVARVNITPELPIWLSGYAARNKPAAEMLDDLWAKALVLEDGADHRAVLVTMDLVGIDRSLSREVCRRIEQQHQLPRMAIALATSHTHSGPVMRGNLVPMYALNEDQTARVQNYAVQLADNLVDVVGDAIATLAPARLSWGTGTATFAVNRRNNPEGQVVKRRQENGLVGPVDHDVPVLAIHDSEGRLRAVVAGYACHATVLSGYHISADWPGAAQNEFERRHPNTVMLFWAGCGADQNPLPRRSVALMNEYGRQFADAIDAMLDAPLTPIAPSLRTAYEEIDLPFGPLPTRAELELTATGERPQGPWARYLLSVWEDNGGLPKTYPYPIQAWRLGTDVAWVFLGGEVVVDYALRLKSELDGKNTWVASYSNDVMGYIPSRRVLAEGGYEGGLARFPYGLPAVWDPNVEQQIIDAVTELTGTD
ncbi:MAG: neutral/alkaline non-lysosomal ceramidase N-terminal domain-containing protein [Pirellulales bacterium]